MNAESASPPLSIDATLEAWRQGDVVLSAALVYSIHLADLTAPLTPEARQTAETHGAGTGPDLGVVFSEPQGVVVLTQTCDIVRSCNDRPYVTVARLVEVSEEDVEATRRLKRPRYAFVPGVAGKKLIADLDQVTTVEKSVLARWTRTIGCVTDQEARDFARAIARKHARFAFPDDFVRSSSKFQERLKKQHDKSTAEGAHLRALREIRVRAAPSWDDAKVKLAFWFVIEDAPDSGWAQQVESWVHLFDVSGRYTIEAAIPCRLEDMTAEDYVSSDHLDLDQLSTERVSLRTPTWPSPLRT